MSNDTTLANGAKGPLVVRLQRALNVALDRNPPLRTDGDFGDHTATAVREFQNLLHLVPDGSVTPALMDAVAKAATTRGWLEDAASGDAAPWLAIARGELGQKDLPGPAANLRILEYIATYPSLAQIPGGYGLPMSQSDDTTAWCACFVHWCLLRTGQKGGEGSADASALSWASYGTVLKKPKPGAITVIVHGPNSSSPGQHHVGFWLDGTKNAPRLLGGNQGNAVSEATFPNSSVVAWVWPA